MKRKKYVSHTKACVIHARRRMAQRVGVSLSRVKLASMIKAIQRNRAYPIGRSSRYRTHFLFSSGGNYYVAVYSKKMKTIITVWDAKPGAYDPEMAVAV